MGDSYRAILKGDRLEWTDVAPEHLAGEQPVEVTILNEPDEINLRRKRMAEALEKLAAMDAFSEISDPSEWQREIREDRPLPN
jgi:predicted HAD superfamily phosphohydrolase YqeG